MAEPDLNAIEGLLAGESIDTDQEEEIVDDQSDLPPALGDEEPAQEGESEEETPEAEAKPAFKITEETTLGELADHNGVKLKDLYNVQVPIDQDEKVSLSELKDHWKERVDYEARETDLQDKVSGERNEIMVTRRLISSIMSSLGGQASPEVIEAVQQSNQQLQQREGGLLLKAVPEWQDANTYRADRQEMVDFVSNWGFTSQDLSNVIDHRLVKMIRDVSKFNGRVRKARENLNKPAKTPGKPSGKVKPVDKVTKLTKQAKTSGKKEDQVAAIDALIS